MTPPDLSNSPWSSAATKAPRRWWQLRWSDLLWHLVFPQGGARIAATTSGAMLIFLALGIGIAAYNAANNILFITLSLLLACLILSGVMSWLNFKDVNWRLLLAPPLRAGQETVVSLELHNAKRLLPTYGLWFDLVSVPPAGPPPAPAAPRTWRGKAAWATAAPAVAPRLRGRLFLRQRLGPGEGARLDWVFKPARRGRHRIALEGIGSLVPFGFLRKSMGSTLRREAVVWPAPVDYRWHGAAAARPQPSGERVSRAGSGTDLLALRKYEPGDSHRLIHWKASARQQQLLVRQFTAESQQAYALWVRTPAEVWVRAEQFELLVGFAASLAEDLFRGGRLRSVALNGAAPRPVNRVRDLEAFLDELAEAEPRPEGGLGGGAVAGGDEARWGVGRKNLLTFAPDGPRGVAAFVDGTKAATA